MQSKKTKPALDGGTAADDEPKITAVGDRSRDLPPLTAEVLPSWVTHIPLPDRSSRTAAAPAKKPPTAPTGGKPAPKTPGPPAPAPAAKPVTQQTRPGELISDLPEVAWPAVPSDQHLRQLAILFQFELTQWWSAERIRDYQFRQLGHLLRHAHATVPYYRRKFSKIGFNPRQPLRPEDWARLPILERRDLQENFYTLKSSAIPAGHGMTFERSSSGSTGMAIRVIKTGVQQLMWQATSLRDHLWQRRDLSARLAAIKIPEELDDALYPDGKSSSRWGSSSSMYRTGPGYVLNVKAKVHEQVDWLQLVKPDYLLSLPSNLEALAHYCIDRGIVFPALRELRTISEVLRPEVRSVCRKAFGVEVKDLYSAEEVGNIALQSPVSEEMLIQGETIFVEILDEQGRECTPGEVGRIVVTPLHAFAMPLIRYSIGDMAEAGGAASCGRGLPVISQVLGRVRNMVRLPDGTRHFPSYHYLIEGFDKVIQFQIVRKEEELLEMRLVSRAPLDAAEEAALTARVQDRFRYPFEVRFRYVDEIPRTSRGKYMDYVSEFD